MQYLTFNIQGMTSANCANTLSQMLKKLKGVRRVEVTLEPGTAIVRADTARIKPAQIQAAVSALGFEGNLVVHARGRFTVPRDAGHRLTHANEQFAVFDFDFAVLRRVIRRFPFAERLAVKERLPAIFVGDGLRFGSRFGRRRRLISGGDDLDCHECGENQKRVCVLHNVADYTPVAAHLGSHWVVVGQFEIGESNWGAIPFAILIDNFANAD